MQPSTELAMHFAICLGACRPYRLDRKTGRPPLKLIMRTDSFVQRIEPLDGRTRVQFLNAAPLDVLEQRVWVTRYLSGADNYDGIPLFLAKSWPTNCGRCGNFFSLTDITCCKPAFRQKNSQAAGGSGHVPPSSMSPSESTVADRMTRQGMLPANFRTTSGFD